jgi:glycosyltransferase involved in cell wall biosynthesis
MGAARIVVQPNLGPETFGMTVAEASALGRPVVASDVGGLNEVLAADETALLVPAGSVEALEQALRRLLESEELRRKLGDAGKRRMETLYAPSIHLQAQVEAYQRIISSS